MTTAVANADDLSLRKFLVWSLCLHLALAIATAVGTYLNWRGNEWAGLGATGGDNVRVNLVSSAGIPMPNPPVVTESQTVDPTKGLYQEEPPKVPEPKQEALEIPKFAKEKPLPPSRKSHVFENPTPPPPNAVPFGKGGNPKIPTGYSETPGAPSNGVAVQAQGGGDFATRYGWYIEAAKRRVAPNWDPLSIDASVRNSQTLHCSISFVINRDGSIKNARVSESSGNLSWDNAGLRAILGSNPFPPLPSDYNYPEVSVIWDFPTRIQ